MSQWNGSFFPKKLATKAAEVAVQTACIVGSDAANVRFRGYFRRKTNQLTGGHSTTSSSYTPFFAQPYSSHQNKSSTATPHSPSNGRRPW